MISIPLMGANPAKIVHRANIPETRANGGNYAANMRYAQPYLGTTVQGVDISLCVRPKCGGGPYPEEVDYLTGVYHGADLRVPLSAVCELRFLHGDSDKIDVSITRRSDGRPFILEKAIESGDRVIIIG